MTENLKPAEVPKPKPPPELPSEHFAARAAAKVGNTLEKAKELPGRAIELAKDPGKLYDTAKQALHNKVEEVKANPLGYGAEATLKGIGKVVDAGPMTPTQSELLKGIRDAGPGVRAWAEIGVAKSIDQAKVVAHAVVDVAKQELRRKPE